MYLGAVSAESAENAERMGALLAVLGAAAPDEGEDDIAFLWREYQAGRVHPDALARLQRPEHLDGNVQNTLVCLEVAAGRCAVDRRAIERHVEEKCRQRWHEWRRRPGADGARGAVRGAWGGSR